MTDDYNSRIDRPLIDDEIELLERVAETEERGDLAKWVLKNVETQRLSDR